MYNFFAQFYDELSLNVEYEKRARYFDELINEFGIGRGILLDLACGTGTLSFEMEKLGYDVIGTDLSEEMLDEAIKKKLEINSSAIFLNQDMTELDMFGTVSSTICSLDSVNHLDSLEKVEKTFGKVSLFTEPGGVLIFDVNTSYKHTEILGDNAFVFENEDCFLAWQNEVEEDKSVNMYLDFFIPNGEGYSRESEFIKEYFYSDEELETALNKSGLEVCAVYDDLSKSKPHQKSERKIFVARKI